MRSYSPRTAATAKRQVLAPLPLLLLCCAALCAGCAAADTAAAADASPPAAADASPPVAATATDPLASLPAPPQLIIPSIANLFSSTVAITNTTDPASLLPALAANLQDLAAQQSTYLSGLQANLANTTDALRVICDLSVLYQAGSTLVTYINNPYGALLTRIGGGTVSSSTTNTLGRFLTNSNVGKLLTQQCTSLDPTYGDLEPVLKRLLGNSSLAQQVEGLAGLYDQANAPTPAPTSLISTLTKSTALGKLINSLQGSSSTTTGASTASTTATPLLTFFTDLAGTSASSTSDSSAVSALTSLLG